MAEEKQDFPKVGVFWINEKDGKVTRSGNIRFKDQVFNINIIANKFKKDKQPDFLILCDDLYELNKPFDKYGKGDNSKYAEEKTDLDNVTTSSKSTNDVVETAEGPSGEPW